MRCKEKDVFFVGHPYSFLTACVCRKECLSLCGKMLGSVPQRRCDSHRRQTGTLGVSHTDFPEQFIPIEMIIVRKAKKKIVRPDGMHEAWVYQSTGMTPITFKQVVQECAASCGEPSNKTLGVVTALVDRIAHYLELGRQVQIDGIGTLKPVINSASAATADELGQPTESIKGVKVRFYPHGPLQEAIAENGYDYQSELDDK